MIEINGAKKTLGLALIIQNETDDLYKLFNSFTNLDGSTPFDEIVVAWNGDNPKTKEILESFGCKVLDYEWIDDFAHARQFSFDNCSCDYIMWLDADDSLKRKTGGDLLQVVQEAFSNPRVYSVWMPYDYDHDKDGNVSMTLWRERILKRDTHRWKGAIHESCLPVVDGCNFRTEKVFVGHNVDHERVKRSGPRNLRISKKEYDKEHAPGAVQDPRTTLYYAKSLHAMYEYKEAIPVFEEYLETSEWDDERYQVYLILCDLYTRSKQYHKALDVAGLAMRLKPMYGQAYYAFAKIYFHMERWDEVIHYSEIGARCQCPMDIMPVDPTEYSIKPLLLYEQALFRTGQAEKYTPCNRDWFKEVPFQRSVA